MHLTAKQIELLRVIAAGNGDAGPADLDEILDRVRYETSKQSLQFSIRALVERGIIEKKGIQKRRGRQRQVIGATKLGLELAGVKQTAPRAFIEDNLISESPEDEILEP